jgi:hypothetical protein
MFFPCVFTYILSIHTAYFSSISISISTKHLLKPFLKPGEPGEPAFKPHITFTKKGSNREHVFLRDIMGVLGALGAHAQAAHVQTFNILNIPDISYPRYIISQTYALDVA